MAEPVENYLAAWLKDTSNGDTSNATRQTARTALNALVGTRVYLSRRPAPAGNVYQITMQRISTEHYNDLGGESCFTKPMIQLDVWGKGDKAPYETGMAAEWLRQSLAGYRGNMTKSNPSSTLTNVTVSVVRSSMQSPSAPTDGNEHDGWDYHWSLDVEVAHAQTEV